MSDSFSEIWSFMLAIKLLIISIVDRLDVFSAASCVICDVSCSFAAKSCAM